jgi:hypothetical protein
VYYAENQPTFRRNIQPPSEVSNSALLATCFHSLFLLGLIFDPHDGGDVPSKSQMTFNGLHGVISQKI